MFLSSLLVLYHIAPPCLDFFDGFGLPQLLCLSGGLLPGGHGPTDDSLHLWVEDLLLIQIIDDRSGRKHGIERV
jgi:hypothetical protein